MAERIVWGLDIGGTKCALAAANEQGDILYRYQIATRDYPQWEDILETLVKAGEASAPRPLAVGVSCGGPLDSQRGLVLSPPNLPGWDEVPITAWLQKRLGVPAYLQNDANACALAEWQYGAGQGSRSMAFLTFGTGLGAGLILDGRLYEGVNGMAGEIGHIRMAEEGPVGYGKAGSLEGFCSGGGLKQLAKARLGKDMSARELAEAAEMGDEGAIRVLHESARMLGRGLGILVDVLNLEKIVIGSIFARAEKWFRPEMEKIMEKEALGLSLKVCKVVPAALGEKIGDLAAITTAWIGWRGENQ
ncbi:MAG: ROK family protein [Clostridiales bacterium]|nr:ROK family protein [Clostridiales bacterium]